MNDLSMNQSFRRIESKDRLASDFPNLSILDYLVDINIGDRPLQNTALVAVQHLIETTGSMIEAIIKLGVKESNIFLIGKTYSTDKSVVERLQRMGINIYSEESSFKFKEYEHYNSKRIHNFLLEVDQYISKTNIKNIILLDDGGFCIHQWYKLSFEQYNVVAVEQTTRGLRAIATENLSFPVIEVASSMIKRILEAQAIARAMINAVGEHCEHNGQQLIHGVVGLGNIGYAIASNLMKAGMKTIAYNDTSKLICAAQSVCPARLDRVKSLNDLLGCSDIIYGCTGKQLPISLADFANATKKKRIFISCSSENSEYLSFIDELFPDMIQTEPEMFPLLCYQGDNGAFVFPRSGFPINFQNGPELERRTHIQMTRALLLQGVLEAAHLLRGDLLRRSNGLRYILSPRAQTDIMNYLYSNKCLDDIDESGAIEDYLSYDSIVHFSKYNKDTVYVEEMS